MRRREFIALVGRSRCVSCACTAGHIPPVIKYISGRSPGVAAVSTNVRLDIPAASGEVQRQTPKKVEISGLGAAQPKR